MSGMIDENKELAALDELFSLAGKYKNNSDFTKLMDFIGRFPAIAPYNAMLMHVQKPNAEYVLTASEWFRKFGLGIKPDARPIVILRPFGPVKFVFDFSDTEGDKSKIPEEIRNPFAVYGKIVDRGLIHSLYDRLPALGIEKREDSKAMNDAGFLTVKRSSLTGSYTEFSNFGSQRVKILFTMSLNTNYPEEEKFITAVHELAHLFCGHIDLKIDNQYWPKRHFVDGKIKEFEAESVAWLVGRRLGLNNTSAASYLNKLLNADSKLPDVSLEYIIKSAAEIETLIKSKSIKPKKAVTIGDNK